MYNCLHIENNGKKYGMDFLIYFFNFVHVQKRPNTCILIPDLPVSMEGEVIMHGLSIVFCNKVLKVSVSF